MKPAGLLSCVIVCAVQAQPVDQSPFSPVPTIAADRLQFTRKLPNIELKDIQGRVWRQSDFLGKFTLVYVWHTFEARIVDARSGRGHDQFLREAGLPDLKQVQRFYEHATPASKLQVLTFCTDYDYTHAPAYMKQAGFTFPVVADWKLIDNFLGADVRNSRYAVIGPEGKLSAPFRSWSFGQLLFQLEAIR